MWFWKFVIWGTLTCNNVCVLKPETYSLICIVGWLGFVLLEHPNRLFLLFTKLVVIATLRALVYLKSKFEQICGWCVEDTLGSFGFKYIICIIIRISLGSTKKNILLLLYCHVSIWILNGTRCCLHSNHFVVRSREVMCSFKLLQHRSPK